MNKRFTVVGIWIQVVSLIIIQTILLKRNKKKKNKSTLDVENM